MAKKSIFSIVKKIEKDSTKAESYNTGLAGEHIIVSSYNLMSIRELESMRIILNGIIKKKKELKRVNEASTRDNNS